LRQRINKHIVEKECSRGLWAIAIILLILVADQCLKIWVKTHFFLGEDLEILPWMHLRFIENNGMAFGIELWSKLLLTLFRIVAVVLLCIGLYKLRCVEKIRMGFFVAVALVTAGAAGNIFDCVFYGEIFSSPMPPEVATIFPQGGGYAGWFEGQVVDMLYFPFFTIVFPEWLPLIGGVEFEFFQYIFNVADASICVGVFLLLLFYSRDFYVAMAVIRGRDYVEADKTNP